MPYTLGPLEAASTCANFSDGFFAATSLTLSVIRPPTATVVSHFLFASAVRFGV